MPTLCPLSFLLSPFSFLLLPTSPPEVRIRGVKHKACHFLCTEYTYTDLEKGLRLRLLHLEVRVRQMIDE